MEINICPDAVKTKRGVKTDRRLLRTKKAIIGALMELLTVKDLSEITVTELTERAGINRKTFYLHYDRIEDIITDFGSDVLAYSDRMLRRYIERSGSVDVGGLFAAINEAITDNLEFFRIFVRSGAYHIFISTAMRNEYVNGLRASVTVLMSEGVYLSPYVMEFMVSGVTAMYIKWLCTDAPAVSLEQLSESASALVRSALGGIEGSGNGR